MSTHKIKMEHVLKLLLLRFFLCLSISNAADYVLQNPDFENVTANVTSQFLLLNNTNSNIIPGWSFNGSLYYVTSGNNLSFQANGGHAIQLAENGRINQTFRGTNNVLGYVLSFNIAVLNEDCADNHHNHTAAVNLTVYQTTVYKRTTTYAQRSKVFFYDRNFSRRLWETNAFYLGQLDIYDHVNLEIKSVTMNSSTSNCWPLVDAFAVKRNNLPIWYDENLLANGDFEVGPPFLNNSSEGILLNEEQDAFKSPLQDWSILGTVRYINSKRYKVPHGKAAIELLSGFSSGVQIDLILQPTSAYTLGFTMGDANDSCVGFFVLFLQIGNDVRNFTMSSYGNGSSFRHSLKFKVEPAMTTSMVFYIFNETRTSEGMLCGPVLDNIVLVGSYGERIVKARNGFLAFNLFIAILGILAI